MPIRTRGLSSLCPSDFESAKAGHDQSRMISADDKCLLTRAVLTRMLFCAQPRSVPLDVA
jgi:hypothetical protein